MTSEMSAPALANLRDQSDFAKADRHSRYIFFLKGFLPLAAFSIVLLFVGSVFYSYTATTDLEVKGLGLNSGNLVMQQPKMAGFDKEGNPYEVNASKAIQNLSKPGFIRLVDINAKLPIDKKSSALIDWDKGTYDSNSEKMTLTANVVIKGARGMDITMQEADIDIKTGKLVSLKPVTVKSGDTDISSDSLVVEDNGERIIFKKRVKMTIKKPVSRGGVASDQTSEKTKP